MGKCCAFGLACYKFLDLTDVLVIETLVSSSFESDSRKSRRSLSTCRSCFCKEDCCDFCFDGRSRRD